MTHTLDSNRDARSYRLSNIDMMRGLVIVLMAIDHARDMFMVQGTLDPLAGGSDIDPALYLTRWITHFCAPVFVFLAGTSAGLMSARKTKGALASFLVKRGLWLVVVEFFIIANAVTFSPFGMPQFGGNIFVALQVIWAIGVSMIILGGVQYLGHKACLWLGILILVGQHLLEPVWPSAGGAGFGGDPLWLGLYTQANTIVGPFFLMGIYPLIPWVGMMLLGYGAVFIFQQESAARNRSLIGAGAGMILLFIAVRLADIYGDPNRWELQASHLATIFDFMNITKYPPSLLFTLITLGPMAIVCALADRWSGWLKDTLVMFGRVPFAFYVTHFLLLHVMSLLFGMYQGFEASQFMTAFFFYPQGYGTDLAGVYLAWIIALMILYPFCRWMAEVKARRRDWWLSYL